MESGSGKFDLRYIPIKYPVHSQYLLGPITLLRKTLYSPNISFKQISNIELEQLHHSYSIENIYTVYRIMYTASACIVAHDK